MNINALKLLSFCCLVGCGSDGVTVYEMEKNTPKAKENPSAPATTASAPKAPATDHVHRPYDYDLPEGWTDRPGSGMRLTTVTIKEGETSIDGSLVQLGPAAGDLLSNVNRWRGQVGLNNISYEELSTVTKKVESSLGETHLVKLTNPEKPDTAILAAIIKVSNGILFAKVMGPLDGIIKNEERFEQWVQSLRVHSH